MPRRALYFLLTVSLLAVPSIWSRSHHADAPPEFNVKEHYTKYEFRIPMRDGKLLFTSVYVPKDSSRTYPFMVDRTPYSVAPYGVDQYRKSLGPSDEFQRAGYIFVYQDVRGRYMSEGEFVEMHPHIDNKKSKNDVDDSSDMYDTVDWLLKNVPNNNGKVGIWGISYPGFYTSASIIDSHPAIKAASPEAPMTNLFMGDDAYHGGAFMLSANFGFYTFFRPQQVPTFPPKNGQRFDYGTQDGYDFYLKMGSISDAKGLYFKDPNWLWDDQAAHDTYDDYWKARNLAPHMKNIHCAVLTVGGWFDAEDLQGPFSTFAAIGHNNPEIFKQRALAATTLAQDGEYLARLDVDIDGVQHRGRAERLAQVADLDECAHATAPAASSALVLRTRRRRASVSGVPARTLRSSSSSSWDSG